jgi:hypothetical protein
MIEADNLIGKILKLLEKKLEARMIYEKGVEQIDKEISQINMNLKSMNSPNSLTSTSMNDEEMGYAGENVMTVISF